MLPNLVNEHILHALPETLKDIPTYAGKYFLMFQKKSQKYIFAKYDSLDQERHRIFLEDSVVVLDDANKYLIICQAGLYHTLFNTMPSILYLHKQDPKAIFIINTSHIYGVHNEEKKLVEFLKLFLEQNKVPYRLVKDSDHIITNDIKDLNSFFIKFITDITAIAAVRSWVLEQVSPRDAQKIYISRSKSNAEKRIDDEESLEDYLSSLGFYIFYPEDCVSIQEQLEYFVNAETVVSITSSGIANAFALKPGATLVELVTPFQFGGDFDGIEMLHQLYSALAYTIDLNYIGVPNKTKNAADLINYIESNQKIKSLLL